MIIITFSQVLVMTSRMTRDMATHQSNETPLQLSVYMCERGEVGGESGRQPVMPAAVHCTQLLINTN